MSLFDFLKKKTDAENTVETDYTTDPDMKQSDESAEEENGIDLENSGSVHEFFTSDEQLSKHNNSTETKNSTLLDSLDTNIHNNFNIKNITENTVQQNTNFPHANEINVKPELTLPDDSTLTHVNLDTEVNLGSEISNQEDELQNIEFDMEIDETDVPQKNGFFKKIFDGLSKTRNSIISNVESVLGAFTKIDDELFEELEEVLIVSDIGTKTSNEIITALRQSVKEKRVTDVSQIKELLADVITDMLTKTAEVKEYSFPHVILMIGTNGVGKTTTIGKLSNIFANDGKKVIVAAGDTFRAAAIDQLEVWANRAGVDIIKHQENSDPGSVIFDAISAAKSRHADVLICDTAGRLHNKKNLMEELKKINKIIDNNFPEAQKEVLLALDSTTGQNAVQQAKLFNEVAEINGIVLTKLDGTAKGGIVISICNELGIPVKYIGIGESINDLQPFDPRSFAFSLFFE